MKLKKICMHAFMYTAFYLHCNNGFSLVASPSQLYALYILLYLSWYNFIIWYDTSIIHYNLYYNTFLVCVELQCITSATFGIHFMRGPHNKSYLSGLYELCIQKNINKNNMIKYPHVFYVPQYLIHFCAGVMLKCTMYVDKMVSYY